jgi:hypothetical protein
MMTHLECEAYVGGIRVDRARKYVEVEGMDEEAAGKDYGWRIKLR